MKYWLWLLLLPLLIAVVGWRTSTSVQLDVGEPRDSGYLRGFHAPEAKGQESGRWTTPDAMLRLPTPNWPAEVAIQAAVPPVTGRVTAVLPRAAITLPPPAGSTAEGVLFVRHYRFLLVPQQAWHTDAAVRFLSTKSVVNRADPRTLGIFIRYVFVKALPEPSSWLPLAQLVALALLTGGSWLLFRLGDAPDRGAVIAAASLGSVLAAAWGWQRLWVDPYLWPLVVGMGWIAGILLLVRFYAPVSASPATLLALLLAAPIGLLAWIFVRNGWLGLWFWHGPPLGYLPLALFPLALLLAHGHPRSQRIATTLIVVVALVFGITRYASIWDRDWASDFAPLLRGPRGFWRGEPLYDLSAITANPFGPTYKYPPFFALIMRPLISFSPGPVFQTWKTVQVGFIALAAYLLWSAETKVWRSWSTLWLVLLLAVFPPIVDTIGYGQVDSILVLLMAAGLWAIRRERWMLLGILLAAAALIKLYPVYLMLLPLIRKRWQGLWGFLLGLSCLGLMSLATLGVDVHILYLRDVLPLAGSGTGWIENQTFNGFLNRLLNTTSITLSPANSATVQWATYAAAAAVTLVALWWCQFLPDDLAYALLITGMLIILPVAWIHYEAVLLIPMYILFVHAERDGGLHWSRAVPLALAWGLLCFGNQWTFFSRTLHGPFWQLILSYKLYGMLLLFVVLGCMARPTVAKRFVVRQADLAVT